MREDAENGPVKHAVDHATKVITAAHRVTFRAFAATVVPELSQATDATWTEIEATVEHALAERPERMRRQLALLLRVLENLPRARYGRPFSALSASRRTAVVDVLQHAPVKLVRRGIWGLRTLVLMGTYTRAAMMAEVGYRASPHGWAARSDGARVPASHGDVPARASGDVHGAAS